MMKRLAKELLGLAVGDRDRAVVVLPFDLDRLVEIAVSQLAGAARRFHGSARLDPLKLSTQAQQIANEIVARLMKPGVSVELTLELKADSDGFSEDLQRVITENARTLKFDSASFEEG